MSEDEIIVDYLISMMVFHAGMEMDPAFSGRYVWEGLCDATLEFCGVPAHDIPACLK